MLGGIVTALLLVLFVAGWLALYHPRRRREMDEAALLPLRDDPRSQREDGR